MNNLQCIVLYEVYLDFIFNNEKLIHQIRVIFYVSQELVSSKNGNRLKKRLCIAVVVLVVIGLCIAALIHYGRIKPNGSKELMERLNGG